MSSFTNDLISSLNSTCGESSGVQNTRFLQEQNSTNATLVDKVRGAIDSVNNALKDAGITITGSVAPYFDSSKFAVGVSTTLAVTFVSMLEHVVFPFPFHSLLTVLRQQIRTKVPMK